VQTPTSCLAFGFIPGFHQQNSRMARKASSKPDSGSSSTATFGFEANFHFFEIRHSEFVIPPALPGQLFYSTQPIEALAA
jgi:hypothetical protein